MGVIKFVLDIVIGIVGLAIGLVAGVIGLALGLGGALVGLLVVGLVLLVLAPLGLLLAMIL